MIAIAPRLHASLIGDLWSITASLRVRFGVAAYWRGIAIAIEIISALATLGIVAALPVLLTIVAKPIRSVMVGFIVPPGTVAANSPRDIRMMGACYALQPFQDAANPGST